MAGTALAQMMDANDGMGGGGWWWVWLVGGVVLVALVVVLLVETMRRTGGPGYDSGPVTPAAPSPRAAEDILAERFARGEIDAEEFRSRREALRS
jgi:putative membrane protein